MKIALVGNQNSGKTTLFNLLTGTNQKVGNWPGVTIERKVGMIKDTDFEIVDLPGIYSLSPYTAEEDVSRKFVLEEKIDLIINIIDATSIERSLYLTTQLLELDCRVIIALNMSDMLERKGIKIDASKLENILDTTIIEISALRKTGIDNLINAIKSNNIRDNRHQNIYNIDIENAIIDLKKKIDINNKRFVAVKILESDQLFSNYYNKEIEEKTKKIENKYQMDMEQLIAHERYNYIVDVKNKAVVTKNLGETKTDKLDKIFLNKWLAIPIFALIMFLVYFLAVGVVGSATVDMIDNLTGEAKIIVAEFLGHINASGWMVSLICNGIIAGVGAVLNFLPQLMILFLCIALLETSGYMSRIAFFLDKIFKKFGLSGKSLIPFIVGSGCSVPGIMTTRTIEDEKEKRMTIMLTPFIPCSAKLPIIALFAGFFFDKYSGLVSASLYFLAIVIILLSAVIMKKYFFKGDPSAYISELPEYKAPSLRYISRDVFDKTWAFIKRAGSIILLCSIIIWVLLSFTYKFEYIETDYQKLDLVNVDEIASSNNILEYKEVITRFNNDKLQISFLDDNFKWSNWIDVIEEEKLINLISNYKEDKRKELSAKIENNNIYFGYSLLIDDSILANIGQGLSFIFYPILGEMNWAATVSAIQGLVAKEQVVSSMAVISGFSEGIESGELIFKENGVFGGFNQVSAYAFLVFNLFSAPCFGAIGAMKKELGSNKRLIIAVAFQTLLAWVIASLIGVVGILL